MLRTNALHLKGLWSHAYQQPDNLIPSILMFISDVHVGYKLEICIYKHVIKVLRKTLHEQNLRTNA